MEQGQHAHDHVAFFRERIQRLHLLCIDRQIGMRQHPALGHAGRSAGILQDGKVRFRIDDHRLRVAVLKAVAPQPHVASIRYRGDLAAAESAQGQSLADRQHVGKPADNQPFERGFVDHLDRGRQQGSDVDCHEQAGARILHLSAEFVGGVERREVHHRRAGHHRAVIGRNIDRDIRQEQADAVALRNSHRLKPGCEVTRLVQQLNIGIAPPQKIDAMGMGAARRSALEQFRQRNCLELRIPGQRVPVIGRSRMFRGRRSGRG